MPLRKPSEFFNDKNPKSSFDSIKEELNSAAPEKVEKISEAFDSFKYNLNHLQALSDFTKHFDTFKENADKVNILSESIDSLKSEIEEVIKKEDLDNAMVSQLFFVEESIKKVQDNIKTINSKTLSEIKEEFYTLSNLVEGFLSVDVPHYKNLVSQSEIRIDERFSNYKELVDSEIDESNKILNDKLLTISETVEGINEKNLSSIRSEVSKIDKKLDYTLEEELPKYKKFFAETEIKTESRITESEKNLKNRQENLEKDYQKRIVEVKSELDQFVKNEIPKYRNIIVESSLKSEEEVRKLSNKLETDIQDVNKSIEILEERVRNRELEINESLEKNLSDIESFVSESREEISTISKTYNSLYKDFKGREISENRKLEEYSEKLNVFSNRISTLEESLTEEISSLQKNLDLSTSNHYDTLKSEVEFFEQNISEKVKDLEINFYRNEKHIEDAKNHLQETLSRLKVDEIEKKNTQLIEKVSQLESILEQFNEKQILTEELAEPPSTKTSDPLTPLDQNYVTLQDLQNHYKLFINRVQQQLASIGGGGETRFEFLDDVDRQSVKTDGNLAIYDQTTSKWVGIASTAIGNIGIQSAGTLIGSGFKTLNFIGLGNTFSVNGDIIDISISGNTGAGGTWAVSSAGIHTEKNVGIATTARSEYSLYVQGDGYFTGNVSVGGTITYEDVTNVDSIGIVTARSGIDVLSNGINVVGASTFQNDVQFNANINHTGIATFGSSNGIGTVTVGLGNTALLVDGNARVTGILTVGKASIVIDGENNTITAGDVTISNSSITLGPNVTLDASATGINSAPNVIYVAKDGSDSSNGTTIDNAKLTISGAVAIATTGTVIKVLAGNYSENNPIEVPAFVSIVGDDLKTVTVTPNTANKDIFHVRKGCYLTNMTFTNHVHPAAAVGFPTSQVATNVGGGKWESPYIQNCTSNTTTGIGLRVDGAQAEGLKSIVCDSFTQYNQGGVGVAVTNEGFAQLVSVFTICCDKAISCHKGGQVDLTNSNSSFGTYGLVADGVSDLQFSGIVTTTANVSQDTVVVAINTTTRPYDGQLVYFDTLYNSIETISVSAGGTGYTSTPTVTIDAPTGPNGETATAFATLDGDSVSSITIISSGSQYESAPNITISSPDVGINTATAVATMAPIYYTINSSTPVVAGITTLTLEENLLYTVGVASTAYFHQVSRIVASSHTFEYVGSGNDITSATPKRGGTTVQQNEVVTTNGGRVVYTSTDQSGNFRIGDGLQINQNTGTISGRAFSRSLFSEMTPFILALS